MTQKTTENPDHPRLEIGEEPEDFSKVVKTDSGHLALVDASVLRNNPHPLVKDAVIFPTKQTPGEEVAFLVKAEYDDATLRAMEMRPAELEEIQQHEQKKSNREAVNRSREKMDGDDKIPGGLADDMTPDQFDPEALAKGLKAELEHTDDPKIALEIAMDHLVEDEAYYDKLEKMEGGQSVEEDVQIRGHDRRGGLGNSVAKKISKIDNIITDPTKQRKRRQSKDEPKDPKTDVRDHVKGKMAQRVGSKNSEADNNGQPQSKKKKKVKRKVSHESLLKVGGEIVTFLEHVKNDTVSDAFLNTMQHTYQINEGLKGLRSKIARGECEGNLDLVHESVDILDKYHRSILDKNIQSLKDLLEKGIPLGRS